MIISQDIELIGFNLRKIEENDSEKMLKWRNQDYVRKNMKNQHIISREEHKMWFSKMIISASDLYFIFQYKNTDCGMICLNNINKNDCEFGFYIGEKKFLSRGFGFVMEFVIIDYVFQFLRLEKIKCFVLKSNISAYNLHKRFGFLEVKEDKSGCFLELAGDSFLKKRNSFLSKIIKLF